MYNHLFQLGALSKLTSWLRWRQEVHHKDDVQTRWKGLRSSHQWAARIVPMSGAVVEAQLWANYSDRKHDQKPQKGSFLEGTSRLVKYYNLAHHTITGGCSRQQKSSCFLTFWFGGQGLKKNQGASSPNMCFENLLWQIELCSLPNQVRFQNCEVTFSLWKQAIPKI